MATKVVKEGITGKIRINLRNDDAVFNMNEIESIEMVLEGQDGVQASYYDTGVDPQLDLVDADNDIIDFTPVYTAEVKDLEASKSPYKMWVWVFFTSVRKYDFDNEGYSTLIVQAA